MKNIIEYNIGENRKLILRPFRQNGGIFFSIQGVTIVIFLECLSWKINRLGRRIVLQGARGRLTIFYSARKNMLHRCLTNLLGGPAIGRPSDQSHAAGSRTTPGSLQNCKDESTDPLRKIQEPLRMCEARPRSPGQKQTWSSMTPRVEGMSVSCM